MPKAALHFGVYSEPFSGIPFDECPNYLLAAAFIQFSVAVLSIGYHAHTAGAAVMY